MDFSGNFYCVKDKVVIITGGAGILGRGIAGHLAEEGAKIVILDRAAEVGEQIVADIKAKGGEASFFLTDVLNKEILEQNKKDILAKYGRIDALLNAAGGNMAGATIGPDSNLPAGFRVPGLDQDARRAPGCKPRPA